MVWFTFTFLLGIPNEGEGEEEEDEDAGEKSQVDSDYVEIEITKPNFSCHIEYVLIPWEPAKFIDIVCWNGAAKIYFENSTSPIVPLKVEKLRWIHFRVNHQVKIKTENVPEFCLHKVRFNVTVGNKNLKEPAKSDRPKKFYGPNFAKDGVENEIRKQLFQPLSENLDDLQVVSVFKEYLTSEQQLYIALDTTLETSPNFKKLFKVMSDFSNEYHDENYERKPTPPFQEIPPLVDITQPPPIIKHQLSTEIATVKKGKDTKPDKKNSITEDQKKKKGKPDKKSFEKVKESEMEFVITGEEFLSWKKTCENSLKYNSEELPFLYCMATAKNILTPAQTKIYNPLSIVISSLNYLPVEELQNGGVTNIKFKFLICDQFLAESHLIPIEWRMKTDFARTIFTDMLNTKKLIYFIQTGGLTIEILGCGEKADSKECVLLGKVWADISPILLRPHRILMKCSFQLSLLPTGNTNSAFTSVNEFNAGKKKRGEEKSNPLRFYSKASIILTLRVALGQAITSTWQEVISNPDLYSRLFAVFYKPDLASPIIQMIQSEVDEILGLLDYTKNGINLKRPLSKYNEERTGGKQEYPKTKMTGFIIDCVDKIFIYVESSVFGGVQKVWAITSFMSTQQGRVLYDSSLIFLDRLYENLFQFGGFIRISLKESPNVILSKPLSWGSNSIPSPAMRALRSLNLLDDCKSIKAAARNNLFPDFESLASLAIEFGEPTVTR